MDVDDDTLETTVSGLVMATDWDDDDEVTALEIQSDDDAYGVEKNAMWDALAELCHTVDYEVVTRIGGHVPRIVVD